MDVRRKIVLPENYGKIKKVREKKIKFSSVLEDNIFNLVCLHNANFPKKKVALDDAKRVVKRGLDLGGDTDSALMRLRNFLSKKAGKPVPNVRYTDDDDLISKTTK